MDSFTVAELQVVGRVSSGEVLVVGAELFVDVEVVEVTSPSVAGESTAMTLSWERVPCSGS